MPGPGCAGRPSAGGGGRRKYKFQYPGKQPAPLAAAARRWQWPAARRENIQACGGMWATGDGNIVRKIFQTGVTNGAVVASISWSVFRTPSLTDSHRNTQAIKIG